MTCIENILRREARPLPTLPLGAEAGKGFTASFLVGGSRGKEMGNRLAVACNREAFAALRGAQKLCEPRLRFRSLYTAHECYFNRSNQPVNSARQFLSLSTGDSCQPWAEHPTTACLNSLQRTGTPARFPRDQAWWSSLIFEPMKQHAVTKSPRLGEQLQGLGHGIIQHLEKIDEIGFAYPVWPYQYVQISQCEILHFLQGAVSLDGNLCDPIPVLLHSISPSP